MNPCNRVPLKLLSEPEFDRIVVVFSDIEMGAGGETDDFPHSDFLGRVLLEYADGPLSDYPVDIVFNGDTFDLVKTPYLGGYPRHITKDVALGKMSAVAAAHPRFFEALSRLLEHPRANKTIHFVVGNHDAELLFPRVQGFLRALCGGDGDRVRFPGFECCFGPVRIEHGCQSDPLFRIDPDRPFIETEGERLLNISWATIALLDVLIPLHPFLYFFDRLRPRQLVMELVPEIKELLVAKAWRYWTKDFWRDFISLKDPVLKFNWTMVKEVVKRLTTTNPDVSIGKDWLTGVVQREPHELFVVGHLHQPGSFYHGTKRVLQLGCFRDEYMVADNGERFLPILKPYLEIYLQGEHLAGLVVKEVRGPNRPAESFPASIYDLVPRVRELLEEMGDRSRMKARQREQEITEAEQEQTTP